MINRTEVSKTISHALRHAPWLYELELDAEGWTPVEQLLAALQAERDEWRALTEAHLDEINRTATKQRFEIVDGRIRALYGHSLPGRLQRSPAEPPEVLFHGTSPRVVEVICRDGLLPMRRQYVHLSADEPTALEVGRRKARQPVLLRVRAAAAHQQGVVFYAGNDKVWLADSVPAEFIDR